MVPEDRRNQGFIPLLSIERNIAVPNYDFLSKASNVNRAEEKKLGIDAVGKLDISRLIRSFLWATFQEETSRR